MLLDGPRGRQAWTVGLFCVSGTTIVGVVIVITIISRDDVVLLLGIHPALGRDVGIGDGRGDVGDFILRGVSGKFYVAVDFQF